MKALVVIIVSIHLFACAGTPPSDVSQTGPNTSDSTKPVRSPHGYIITKDYEPGRFGGFIGDCTDDTNWPYFWQCVSENAGNGGFE